MEVYEAFSWGAGWLCLMVAVFIVGYLGSRGEVK